MSQLSQHPQHRLDRPPPPERSKGVPTGVLPDGSDESVTADLRGLGRLAEFPARATVLSEGDTARGLYLIIAGRIMLSKLLPDGRRQICEILSPNKVFGITPTNRYHSSAEALTPVHVMVYDRSIVDRSLPLKLFLVEQLKAQVCGSHDHALLLGRKSAVERVASFILDLLPAFTERLDGHEPSLQGNGLVRVPMTRLEIADYLGLTLETVSRAFSRLKRDGVLAYDRADSLMQVNLRRLKPLTGTY
ncbi:MAG: helix-turn-helix domain-containing protein [Hyphomicrobiales bacterium]